MINVINKSSASAKVLEFNDLHEKKNADSKHHIKYRHSIKTHLSNIKYTSLFESSDML